MTEAGAASSWRRFRAANPRGVQVGRNQPPQPGRDDVDHPTLHPGEWRAFADVSGQDSWRKLAGGRPERFTENPAVRDGRLAFAAESRMMTANRQTRDTPQRQTQSGNWSPPTGSSPGHRPWTGRDAMATTLFTPSANPNPRTGL